jgi:hypothetical protein
MNKSLYWLLPVFMLGLLSSVAVRGSVPQAATAAGKYFVYYGAEASATEKAVARDLQGDLSAATGAEVVVRAEPRELPSGAWCFLMGTPASSRLIGAYLARGVMERSSYPAAGGGLMQVIPGNGGGVVVLSGLDVEGTQNTVYEYSRTQLGIDPLAYWTGYAPKRLKNFRPGSLTTTVVAPPRVPIICYMENDVDELANMHKPYLEYDMDTWKGMVNSLRRMHYNAIQLFDMLGRSEFYTRGPYKKLRPGYTANIALVDSMIDYAHLKGIKIQIAMGLGYQIRSITDSQALCWSRYKKDWIDTWIYYLTKTPLGKADIYSLRPRNQVWDRAYVSSCGEDKVQVFNDVFHVFDSLLQVYKPRARKIAVCYDDGMEMFNGGFSPPKDFIVAWSDDGYCGFKTMPVSSRGYDFGTYMHAGFWTNHTVHDPYPLRIDSVLNMMGSRYHAFSYLEVNGQTFRPFLLNLEAFADWGYDPGKFHGADFYRKWCVRYFGPKAAPRAVASMKALHAAQYDRTGYVRNLGQIKSILGFLSDKDVLSPDGKPYRVGYEGLHFNDLDTRMAFLDTAFSEAAAGLKLASGQDHFYYDFVYLPALMYHQLMAFEITILKAARLKHAFQQQGRADDIREARRLLDAAYVQLEAIYKTCYQGDKNPRWATWYDPAKRRPNNGFPTFERLKASQENLAAMDKKTGI